MAGFLRKFYTQIVDENSAAISAPTVSILRIGAEITRDASVGTDTIACVNTGSLKFGDMCYVIRDGSLLPNVTVEIVDTVWTYITAEGDWDADVNITGTYTITAGDRLVLTGLEAGHFVNAYTDDIRNSTPVATSFSAGTDGVVEKYIDAAQVDVKVVQNSETEYVTDVVSGVSERVTPQMFGAVVDGSTDDSKPVLQALEFGALHGVEVHFPAGTYKITSTMTQAGGKPWQTRPLFIRGEGIGLTKWTTDEQDGPMIDLYAADVVSIEGITFQGSGTGTNGAASGIRIFGNATIDINRCEFIDFGADGLTIARDSALTTTPKSAIISNCVFDNCRRGGIVATSGDAIKIQGCYFGDTLTATGVAGSLGASINIEENAPPDSYELGHLAIVGNTILGGISILEYAPTAADAGLEAIVTGNTISGYPTSDNAATQGGGEITVNVFQVNKLVFTDNVCHQRYTGTKTTNTAAFTFRSNSAKVSDNYFEADKANVVVSSVNNSTSSGAEPTAGEFVSITDNVIVADDTATQSSGLTVVPDGLALRYDISRNQISDLNGSYGIRVDCASGVADARIMTIRGNVISGTVTYGINLKENNGGASSNSLVHVTDNLVAGSTGGIHCDLAGLWSFHEANNLTTGAGPLIVLNGSNVVEDLTLNGNVVLQTVKVYTGSGTPESAVTAPIGSLFMRTDGGASTSFYVKESGTGNTGWVGK